MIWRACVFLAISFVSTMGATGITGVGHTIIGPIRCNMSFNCGKTNVLSVTDSTNIANAGRF